MRLLRRQLLLTAEDAEVRSVLPVYTPGTLAILDLIQNEERLTRST